MADDDEPVAPEEPASSSETEPGETDKLKSSSSTLGEEVFQTYLKGEEGKNFARILNDLGLGNKVAAIYIDARSGGVFFQGNAQVGGSVAGRDYTQADKQTGGKEKAAVGYILLTDLKKINAVYVECPPYPDAQKKLNEKALTILRGRSHTGKWTAAVHLLNRLHPKKVIELDPSARLDQLAESITSDRGYVVDNLSFDGVEGLSTFSVTRLSEKLHEKNSHMVITVNEKSRLPSNGMANYMVAWEMKVDIDRILDRHLEWYAPNMGSEEKDRLKNEYSVCSLLSANLLPGEIDRIAELLGSVLNHQMDLASALSRYIVRARDQAKTWFDENENLDDRLLMLTVAVFNGASYQTIANAEKQLKELFPKSETPTSSSSIFGSSRSQRIRRVHAQLKQGLAHNELGKVPIEIVEFDNPNLQPAVLHHAWDEYDQLRDILVTWLGSSVYDAPFDVRVRAAAAVGELSKYDFNEIRGRIILQWAKSEDLDARVAAAMALGIPAWNSETAPLVLKLLHHWSTIDNLRLCWTACASYGGLVGVRFPEAAIQDLYLIARTGDLRLLNALSISMKNLFDAGELVSQYRQLVLDALVAWTENPKVAEGIFGLFIFLSIAGRSWQRADPEGDDWPTLLRLVKKEVRLTDPIVSLWTKAFNIKASRSAAFSVFEDWLKIVQKDMRLEEECTFLAKKIAAGEQLGKQGRMRSYLEQWKRKSDTAVIAGKILAQMQ
jgi:hypothetical protein